MLADWVMLAGALALFAVLGYALQQTRRKRTREAMEEVAAAEKPAGKGGASRPAPDDV